MADSEDRSIAERIGGLAPELRRRIMTDVNDAERDALAYAWRFFERPKQIARTGYILPKIHFQPSDQVRDVALAFAQVRVGHFVEHDAELIEHLLDCPFSIHLLIADERLRSCDQHRVVEHQ